MAAGFNAGDLVAGTSPAPLSALLAQSITIDVAATDLSVAGADDLLTAIEARRDTLLTENQTLPVSVDPDDTNAATAIWPSAA